MKIMNIQFKFYLKKLKTLFHWIDNDGEKYFDL